MKNLAIALALFFCARGANATYLPVGTPVSVGFENDDRYLKIGSNPGLSVVKGSDVPSDNGCSFNGLDDRKSAICAYWAQADAARNSARWSFWQFVAASLAFAGVILSLWWQRWSSERQLRAYVFVRDGKVTGLVANSVPKISFEVFNSGNTPAYDFKVSYDAKFVEVDDPIVEPMLPPPDKKGRASRSSLGAGQKVCPSFTLTKLTAKEAASLKTGKTLLYLYGVVSYRDAFRKERTTSFRAVHEHSRSGASFTMCAEGNGAT